MIVKRVELRNVEFMSVLEHYMKHKVQLKNIILHLLYKHTLLN